ncbi:MAG: hypothetical protein OQK82_03710 [Candidatus Pacearchaeota archaeon]|nr:hypothetical protein [Candidatus Pacearchaeota archaeon]
MTMETAFGRKLELHYFFVDDSHSMDAVVRNECEKELLALFHECSIILGIDFKVESEAFSEGGLKEVWKFFGTNQVATLLVILTIILSRYPPTDEAKEIAEQQLRELQTEETRLNIKKIRLQLKQLEQENIDVATVEQITQEVARSSKVIVRRSNFYEKLTKYKKVKSLSYTQLNYENEPITEERIVLQDDFPRFVMHSRVLKPEIIDNAEIEIIAPVLVEGNYKWKGIYENEPITFSMTDASFRHQVLSKEVSFQNGARIICVLEMHRKLDEAGEIVITGYSVSTVISKHDAMQSIETSQGRTYKQAKGFRESQGDIFDD